jgi:hypothetical protein
VIILRKSEYNHLLDSDERHTGWRGFIQMGLGIIGVYQKSNREREMDDCDILWGNVWLETVVLVL